VATGINDGLVRVSVGLEAFEDLKSDFSAALA
jgi:cystathionine beta-lyase/cystathionine gamma-synthase